MDTSLQQYDETLRWLLARASQLLGEPARPVELVWDVERLLRRQVRRVARSGLGESPPIVQFSDGRPGHALYVGMELQRLVTPRGELRLVEVSLPYWSPISSFYAVGASRWRELYRYVRQLSRQVEQQRPPLMTDELQSALWQNTVGWLLRDRGRMRAFDLPQRRGLLLLGEPGNGKTMACRWLRWEFLRRGLEWKTVNRQEFEEAARNNEVRQFFEVERPGAILFDDFDLALQSRSEYGDQWQGTFLTELDGMFPKSGVVYLFTSNLPLARIDAAALRPGRIDLVLPFPAPSEELRRRMICERWPSEVVATMPLETVVRETEGLSFAELEEVRKLLVVFYLDHGRIDWPGTKRQLAARQTAGGSRRVLGFQACAAARHDAAPSTHTAAERR